WGNPVAIPGRGFPSIVMKQQGGPVEDACQAAADGCPRQACDAGDALLRQAYVEAEIDDMPFRSLRQVAQGREDFGCDGKARVPPAVPAGFASTGRLERPGARAGAESGTLARVTVFVHVFARVFIKPAPAE